MDLSRPYSAAVPSLDGDVLRVLSSSELALSGRQVAAMAGRTSHSGVLKVLDRLAEHGLVHRVELNRSHLYSLNRDHLASPAVELLMGIRNALVDRMRESCRGWDIQPRHVSLFGSAARGDGDAGSDIDLFVVRALAIADDDAPWRRQVEHLRAEVERWTGNAVSVLEVSELGLAELSAARAAILDDLLSDGVLVAGEDLNALLRTW